MLKIIGVGDNVVDKYIEQRVMFPGGNSVNVPVLAKRLGAQAAYIGVLGTDEAGRLMKHAMEQEGIDLSHVKIAEGENGYACVKLVDGDRVFQPGGTGVQDLISFTDEDLAFMKEFDLIHSSVYSYLEHLLPLMHGTGTPVSYDYSDNFTDEYVDKTIPYVTYAFFSAGDMPIEDVKAHMEKIMSKGVKFVLCTRGGHGSIYYDGKDYVEQGIVPANVVDTMGAGDSFIAGFLYHLWDGKDVPTAMEKGAEYAAHNCGLKGTFGYETPMTE